MGELPQVAVKGHDEGADDNKNGPQDEDRFVLNLHLSKVCVGHIQTDGQHEGQKAQCRER